MSWVVEVHTVHGHGVRTEVPGATQDELVEQIKRLWDGHEEGGLVVLDAGGRLGATLIPRQQVHYIVVRPEAS